MVRVSYLEIYNEEIRDLLVKKGVTHLEVKERPDIGVYVKDLSSYVVNNADDMESIMDLGSRNRKAHLSHMHKLLKLAICCNKIVLIFKKFFIFRNCWFNCYEYRKLKISCYIYHYC